MDTDLVATDMLATKTHSSYDTLITPEMGGSSGSSTDSDAVTDSSMSGSGAASMSMSDSAMATSASWSSGSMMPSCK